jgi:hypothetical protein
MAPPKGTTNNPSGRPPKNRALTEILTRELGKTFEFNGERAAAKRIIARSIVQAVVTGKWYRDDGTYAVLEHDEIIDLVKWIYRQVDGDAKAEVDLTSGGETILVTLKGNGNDES